MMNIELRGFYGHSNIGDDLLMIVAFNVVKEAYPKALIHIKTQSEYVKNMLPDAILFYRENLDLDLIVYGGGGLFFDFKEGKARHYLLNRLSSLLGYNVLFKIFDLKGIKLPERRAIGLGIGPFTKSSKIYFFILYNLSKFKYLSVRDKQSYDHVKEINKNSHLYTDLVFARKYWKGQTISGETEKDNSIIIVVRDWKHNPHTIESEINLANDLKAQGYNAYFYLFNPENDLKSHKVLKENKQKVKLYVPEKINEILEDISKSSLIITQRAHGAIIGNVLKVPTICVGIEPKLKNVSEMLKKSSLCFNYPIDPLDVKKAIKNNNFMSCQNVEEDFKTNNEKALAMISDFKNS